MDTAVRRRSLLKRMATLCAVLILAITSISAYIRLSNAGLGCAQWPQCYGERLRQAQQGVAAPEQVATVGARMLHRVVAVAALLLIIIMALTCFSATPVLWREAGLTLVLLALALALALLGRWSSGARVPAVAIGNLLGGFAMLVVCWRLRQQVAAGQDAGAAANPPGNRRWRWWQWWHWLAAAVLCCQVALGGLVSASYAGLSCPSLMHCAGNPAAAQPAAAPLEAFNPWREPAFDSASPGNPLGDAPHLAHRYGALLASLLLLPAGFLASRAGKPGWILLLLLAAQVGLGLLLVALSLPLGIALAHNLVAALLLVAAFSLI